MPQKERLSETGKLMLMLAGPNVRDLVGWLNDERYDYEWLDIHEWMNERWYVILRDRRINKYPKDALIGFTVDLKADRILWAKGSDTTSGNVFLRSERWFRKLRAKFPEAKSDRDHGNGTFYDYRPRRGKAA